MCLEPMCSGALPALHVMLLLPLYSAVLWRLTGTTIFRVFAELTAESTCGTSMVMVFCGGFLRWSYGGSARIFEWSGVLLHCGTVLFIFKKDCILDLNLLHVNDEGKEDVEVEVFLEKVPVEVNGCLSPCERA